MLREFMRTFKRKIWVKFEPDFREIGRHVGFHYATESWLVKGLLNIIYDNTRPDPYLYYLYLLIGVSVIFRAAL